MGAETQLMNLAGTTSVIALWLFAGSAMTRRFGDWVWRLGSLSMLVLLISLAGALACRAVEAGRFPGANLYESLLLAAWAVSATFLGLSCFYRERRLGFVSALLVATIFLLVSWMPPGSRAVAPLAPALVSSWRVIHVPPLIVSYGLFLVAGLLSIVYLFEARRRWTAASCLAATSVSLVAAAAGILQRVPALWLEVFFWGGSVLTLGAALISFRIESRQTESAAPGGTVLGEVIQRCITIAFPLLTFGIITGALWANHAWGTYWSWDPKESMSLVTWLSYALYLHQRSRGQTGEDVLAVLAVFGLLLTVLTYLGFNFLGFGGLHSYGKIS